MKGGGGKMFVLRLPQLSASGKIRAERKCTDSPVIILAIVDITTRTLTYFNRIFALRPYRTVLFVANK